MLNWIFISIQHHKLSIVRHDFVSIEQPIYEVATLNSWKTLVVGGSTAPGWQASTIWYFTIFHYLNELDLYLWPVFPPSIDGSSFSNKDIKLPLAMPIRKPSSRRSLVLKISLPSSWFRRWDSFEPCARFIVSQANPNHLKHCLSLGVCRPVAIGAQR